MDMAVIQSQTSSSTGSFVPKHFRETGQPSGTFEDGAGVPHLGAQALKQFRGDPGVHQLRLAALRLIAHSLISQ